MIYIIYKNNNMEVFMFGLMDNVMTMGGSNIVDESKMLCDLPTMNFDDFKKVIDNGNFYGSYVKHLSDDLRKSEQLFDYVISHYLFMSYDIEHFDKSLTHDFNKIEQAIKFDPLVLAYTSDELKNNRYLVEKAIKIDAGVLECVSDELKNDKNIVSMAIKSNPYSMIYASDEIKDDLDFAINAYVMTTHKTKNGRVSLLDASHFSERLQKYIVGSVDETIENLKSLKNKIDMNDRLISEIVEKMPEIKVKKSFKL